MTQSDLDTFKRLVVEYFRHVSTHPQSLLARIYGIYSVKMEDVEPVSLILMGNTKRSNDKMIEHVFDLKGSFINREEKGKNLKNTATLKDINLLSLKKEKIVRLTELLLYLLVLEIQKRRQRRYYEYS